MQGGEGFLIVFAINSRDSFDEVTIRDQVLRVKDADKVPMVICGNKCDLDNEREVSKTEGEDLAKSFGVPFFECSALSRINIEESFYQLVREIKQHRNSDDPNNKGKGKKSGGGGGNKLAQLCNLL